MRIRLLFGHGLKWGSVISNVEVHHSLFGLVAGSGVLTVNAVPVVVWMIFPYQGEVHSLVTAISMTFSSHSRNYDVWSFLYSNVRLDLCTGSYVSILWICVNSLCTAASSFPPKSSRPFFRLKFWAKITPTICASDCSLVMVLSGGA